MTNRVEQVLAEVQEEILRRRAAGKFGAGYEQGIEAPHDRELGKLKPPLGPGVEALRAGMTELHERIAAISEIERDHVRFAPLRFIRELAMSRHQLIRLSGEVRAIADTFEFIVSEIVRGETERTTANLRAAENLLEVVYERTAVMEKLIVVTRELEQRLSSLEQS